MEKSLISTIWFHVSNSTKITGLTKVKQNRKLKNFIIQEGTKICRRLLEMQKGGLITEEFYRKVRPVGPHAVKLYGLAKAYEKDVPTRPTLSMPGSQYQSLSIALSDILKTVYG